MFINAFEYTFIMTRPYSNKKVCCEPDVDYFKPRGVPMGQLEKVELQVEELEALKLCDLEEVAQERAAARMGISQPTLSRLLSSGRKKLADAIVLGKAIRISGGNYTVDSGRWKGRCCRGHSQRKE
jgi:predicted DNA-binding protein (UPF0251 family)